MSLCSSETSLSEYHREGGFCKCFSGRKSQTFKWVSVVFVGWKVAHCLVKSYCGCPRGPVKFHKWQCLDHTAVNHEKEKYCQSQWNYWKKKKKLKCPQISVSFTLPNHFIFTLGFISCSPYLVFSHPSHLWKGHQYGWLIAVWLLIEVRNY